MPQPVIARVHGIATAAGCQLVATCDLAVAAEEATFATPGVKIGLFCSTPMVAVSRAVGRKRAMEMLLTGTPSTRTTAADWGLVNRVVAGRRAGRRDRRAVRPRGASSAYTLAVGKAAFWEQIDRTEAGAYEHTQQVMAANAAATDAQEGIGAFLDKRARTGRTGPTGAAAPTQRDERESAAACAGGALGVRGNIVEPDAAGRVEPAHGAVLEGCEPGGGQHLGRPRGVGIELRELDRTVGERLPDGGAERARRAVLDRPHRGHALGDAPHQVHVRDRQRGERVALGDRDGRVEHRHVAERGDGVEVERARARRGRPCAGRRPRPPARSRRLQSTTAPSRP